MPTPIRAPIIKGLIPALDRKQVKDVHILEGENFVFDAQGPYSGFGSTLLTTDSIEYHIGAETFRIEEIIHIFTNDGIYRYDQDSKSFYPVMIFSSVLTEKFPWSSALVGGVYYFCKKGLGGVLAHDPLTNTWMIETVNIPVGACSVTQSNGRLIVLGTGNVAWSAIDDGSEAGMLPDTATGAGFQLLALVGYGDPLGVFPAADGFMSYTTTGILKSEFIDSANPFRHYPLVQKAARPNELIPVSPYCIVDMGQNEHVFLSKAGFFRSMGQFPETWQPIFGEYLSRNVLPRYNLLNPLLIRLHLNSDRQWFFVSLSESETEIYTKAFCLYIPRDEWGVFNRNHVAFGEFNLNQEIGSGYNAGYICDHGRVHFFSDNVLVETAITFEYNYYEYKVPVEYPAIVTDDLIAFPTVAYFHAIDESAFPVSSGNYIIDTSGAVISITPASFTSLDAYIDVGLFRLITETSIDSMSEISEVLVGMLEQPNVIFEEEDWLTFPDTDEDWLLLTGDEDWGFAIISTTDYDLTVIGTFDGYLVFENQSHMLTEVYTLGRIRVYPAECHGLFHIARFTAQEVGQSFHLKFLELSANMTGKL